MKKFVSKLMLFFAAILMASTAANAQNAKISIDDFSAKPGQIVDLSINMDNDATAGAVVLTVNLPENLTFYYDGDPDDMEDELFQTTDRIPAKNLSLNVSVSDNLRQSTVVYMDMKGVKGKGIEAGTGAIFTFQVKVADNAAPGKYNLSFEEVSVSDLSGEVALNVTTNKPVLTVANPTFTITTSAENGTIAITPQTEGNVYEQGAVVTLTATANEGYEFAGWSNGSKENPLKVTVSQNAKYTANFTAKNYKLTFDFGDSKVANDVAYGSKITAPEAPAKTGYTFAGWDAEVPATMPAKDLTFTAKWTVNSYTVTYKDGDNVLSTESVNYGAAVKAPEAPTKEGYTFAGWDAELPATMPAKNITFVAKWTVNQYTITFNANGGSAVSAIKQDYGTKIVAPAAPTRTGYTFAGWDKEIPATMPAGDMTITAKWTINQYTITFNTNGGSAVSDIKQDYGSNVTAPVAPTRTGYTFAGWDKEIPATMPAGDMTITAKWTVNSYTVTFKDGDNVLNTSSVNYGAAVQAPEAPTKEGYTFAGWDVEVPATMPAKDLTFTAKWTVNSYNVTFKNGDDETVVPVEYGTAITTPEAPTKVGYTFAGWGELPATMPAKDLTFEAQWKVNSYTVIFMDGETVLNTIAVEYGATIKSPEVAAKDGYAFAGWDIEIPATMPANDLTFKAQWKANAYSITFKDGDIVIKTEAYSFGEAITTPATPTKEGYTFAGWDAEIPATMPANNVTITAKWEVNKYTVTFVVDGEALSTESLPYQSAITAPQAPEKEGYTFAGWTPAVDATVPAKDVTYTAKWEVNTYKVSYYYGDELVNELEVTYGAAMPEYTWTPESENIIFNGWVGETFETMPAHDVVYKADFTDAIRSIAAAGSVRIYSLNGSLVKTVSNLRDAKLPAGVYIVNGKKMVVK